MKYMKIEYEDYVDNVFVTQSLIVPAKNCLCPTCEGNGVMDNPAFSNGFTQDELNEDPDFAEAYFEGRYDVTCNECRGAKVIQIPDVANMNYAQKRFVVKARKSERERAEAHREMAAITRAERAFGA